MTTTNPPDSAARRRSLREIGDRRARFATAVVAAAAVAGTVGLTARTLATGASAAKSVTPTTASTSRSSGPDTSVSLSSDDAGQATTGGS